MLIYQESRITKLRVGWKPQIQVENPREISFNYAKDMETRKSVIGTRTFFVWILIIH